MSPKESLLPELERVLYSGVVGEGEEVSTFEREFAAFIDSPHLLSFSSGTAALHTALILAGVRPGDEVISTAMTAEPTNMSILHCGARVAWADVDPTNGNVTAESIAQKITPRTKAILVVHYGGIPAPIAGINNVARSAGIPVIEDAAHALGARYEGRPIGCHGNYVMFSFQAIKHMTTGDGGMLVLRNLPELEVGRKIRWFGIDRKTVRTTVDVERTGYKYTMNNVTAALGRVQLRHIRKAIDRHISNGKFFDESLSKIAGLEICRWEKGAEPSYWFYTLLADRRDDLSRYLTTCGIDNSLAHRRNDHHSVFREFASPLPGLDAFYSRMLHIPCGWWVDQEAREFIVDCLKKGW